MQPISLYKLDGVKLDDLHEHTVAVQWATKLISFQLEHDMEQKKFLRPMLWRQHRLIYL
jgi:hypothetical protein